MIKLSLLIETFDGRAILVSPGYRTEFESLDECYKFMKENDIYVNSSSLFRCRAIEQKGIVNGNSNHKNN